MNSNHPEELEEQWNKNIALYDESLELLDDFGQAGANGDEARVEEISEEASRRDEESDRIELELGLEKCAS
jgi:hypothetical protein